jgi:hypothetical protein
MTSSLLSPAWGSLRTFIVSARVITAAGPRPVTVTPATGEPPSLIRSARGVPRMNVLSDPHAGERSDDVIDAGLLAAGTVEHFFEAGGEGNDTLRGTPGNDALFGGPGTDRFELRGGNDVTDVEAGEVVVP